MKRSGRAFMVVLLVLITSCTDDRITFARGPLGPASYEVTAQASGESDERQEHTATLRVEPATDGARLVLRSSAGVVTADLSVAADGSVDLTRVRGAAFESGGQTELASLVGQLNPSLPDEPVRLGEPWSSTQRITTRALAASLETELRIVRFRRVASTDAAELRGDVTGRLRVNDPTRPLDGSLTGSTRIVWAVEAGRVVEADTELIWTLSDGTRVTLATSVRSN
ncbi:MAG: hypothetical protein WD826_04100 [Actinomycetota bacterium]